MRTRYTVLPAVALAFAAGACTQGEADRDAADQAVEVITMFQETTQERLDMIESQIDTARMRLDSLGGEVEAEAEARLSARPELVDVGMAG
jgi:chorismate synthase